MFYLNQRKISLPVKAGPLTLLRRLGFLMMQGFLLKNIIYIYMEILKNTEKRDRIKDSENCSIQ